MTDRKPTITLIGVVAVILILLFREAIWHPNSILFASSFDGIKNYYTFIYYILYDKGVHFSGMNYPFGELIIYTDNQPIFSYLLGLIHRHILDLSAYLIGIFNYLIILSLLLGCLVVYKLLRKSLLPPWYSIITAIIIVFFAQQNNMFNFYYGSYALSYTWVIPLQWLLIIKLFEQKRFYTWAGVYVLVVFITGLIHPYYFFFSFLLIAAHALVYLVFYSQFTKTQFLFFLQVLIAGGLPLLAFKAILFLIDTLPDRPVTPWGMTELRGNLAEIFFPAEALLANYYKTLFNLEDSKYDGYGYVGVAGTICFFLSILKGLGYLLRRKFKLIFRPVLPFPLRLGIWPAVIILFFSLGFPFRLHLEALYNLVPFVKQFRVLARFLWVFYYIYSVYVAFYFYQLYRYLKFRQAVRFAYGLLFLVLSSWALDAKINVYGNIKEIRENRIAQHFTGQQNNINDLLAAKGLSKNDFQAILPFPYFTAGSEKIFFQPLTAMPAAMAASVQTGLPLINGMMSRTSLTQSLLGIQLISNDYLEKDLLKFLPNTKPLLLLVVNDSLQYYEKNLIQKGKYITQQDSLTFYQLPLSAFAATAKKAALQKYKQEKASLYQQGNIYTTQPAFNFVYNTFTRQKSSEYLFQAGALSTHTGPLTIFNDKIPQATPEPQEYDCSFWINLASDYPLDNVIYEQFDATHSRVETRSINLIECVEIYKKWVNVQFKFKLLHPQNSVKITLGGTALVVDELLIKPSDLGIYVLTPGNQIIYNNYLIQP